MVPARGVEPLKEPGLSRTVFPLHQTGSLVPLGRLELPIPSGRWFLRPERMHSATGANLVLDTGYDPVPAPYQRAMLPLDTNRAGGSILNL